MTNSHDDASEGDVYQPLRDIYKRAIMERLEDWLLGLLCGLIAGVSIGVMIA